MSTARNRQLALGVSATYISYWMLWLIAPLLGTSMAATMAVQHLLATLATALAVIAFDRRLWCMAPIFAATAAAILVWPAYYFEWYGIGAALSLWAGAASWLRGTPT